MDRVIKRPDSPLHFMVLKPILREVVVTAVSGREIAKSTDAVRMLESGKSLFDPVIYIPRVDVTASLVPNAKKSNSPLKGVADHFDFNDDGEIIRDIAWSYEETFGFASQIHRLIAFDLDKVSISERPTSS